MTTFTVNIEDKRSEKAIKAFLDALELKYDVAYSDKTESSPDKKSQRIYEGLKRSLNDIRKWENGELELKDAKDMLNEL